MNKTPPAYLQQRGQPGDGGGGDGGGGNDGGGDRGGRGGGRGSGENYGAQRINDNRHQQQTDPDNEGGQIRAQQGSEEGRRGQRRDEYREQRRNDDGRPQQAAQGNERGRNWRQNEDDEEENPAGGQSVPSVPSLPQAPEQVSAVAQEGSFVVPHGLPPSSAYVTIARNLPTAERSREAPETREQSEFRPTVVGVLENRERSPACANNVLPQCELFR